jgi:hypothetical protein
MERAALINSGSTCFTPENYRDLREFADAEEDDEHRKQGKGRGVSAELQQRIQKFFHPRKPADHQPQRHRSHHGEGKSGGRSLQAGEDVDNQLSACDRGDEGLKNVRKGGQKGPVEEPEPRHRLPQQEYDQHHQRSLGQRSGEIRSLHG